MSKRKRPIGYNRARHHNGRLKKLEHNAKCWGWIHKARSQGTVADFHWFAYRTSRRSGLIEGGVLRMKGDRHGRSNQAGAHRESPTG